MNGAARSFAVGAVLLALLGTSVVGQGQRTAGTPGDLDIPESAAARRNPQAATPDNVAQGKTFFQSQCAMCHGTDGRGGGDLAVSLDMDMPDFTDPAVQKSRTDGELFYILVNGCRDMPGEGESRLTEAVRWNMILYVRSLEGEG